MADAPQVVADAAPEKPLTVLGAVRAHVVEAGVAGKPLGELACALARRMDNPAEKSAGPVAKELRETLRAIREAQGVDGELKAFLEQLSGGVSSEVRDSQEP